MLRRISLHYKSRWREGERVTFFFILLQKSLIYLPPLVFNISELKAVKVVAIFLFFTLFFLFPLCVPLFTFSFLLSFLFSALFQGCPAPLECFPPMAKMFALHAVPPPMLRNDQLCTFGLMSPPPEKSLTLGGFFFSVCIFLWTVRWFYRTYTRIP